MVVYNVYSECVSYQYKTYLCSKATVILIITSLLTIFFPILFTYRHHGFWLRTDMYQEQPDVSYKYNYILLVDTAEQENVVVCSNLNSLLDLTKGYNHCPIVKTREEDTNRDGINDLLNITFEVAITEGTFDGITLLLFFDYKLTSFCRVHMEVMGVIQHRYAESKAGFSSVADLSLVQRQPLSPRQLDTRYNTSIVPLSQPFSFTDVLTQYSLRNLSAQLINVYSTWMKGRVASELITLQTTILYPETTILYKPTTWQLLQTGWAKLFPVLVIFILVFQAVKSFIFTNRLVYTYKEIPWKKAY